MSTAEPADGTEKTAPAGEYAELTETVRELVKLMREGGIKRLELKRGDLSISLRTHGRPGSATPSGPVVQDSDRSETEAAPEQPGYYVTSPMIGTFYTAPAPGERPFVAVGDAVEVGQTVAIIEAMKIMNEIIAERAGVVEEILVANGEAVEYGHRLMRLRLAG